MPSTTSLFVAETIHQALNLFWTPGGIIEIRVLDGRRRDRTGRPTIYRGYFDSFDGLETELGEFVCWKGCYVTANTPDPALLARCQNRFDTGLATSDKDIVRRRWIPVDLDPKRAADISSSDQEHQAAIERCVAVRAWLRQKFSIESVMADSGNGAHVLIPVDLPLNGDNIAQRVLAVLAEHFDDERVGVDQTMHNPARIIRLYGTLVCKGDSTSDRPHRMSRISHQTPTRPAPAEFGQLEAIAAMKKVRPSDFTSTGGNGKFDIESWLHRHQIRFECGKPGKEGSIIFVLPVCPFNEGHDNRSAVVIQQASGALAFRCHHSSCTGNDWYSLRDLVEPGWRSGIHQTPAQVSVQARPAVPTEDELEIPLAGTEWPAPVSEDALIGPAGNAVRTIMPATESDVMAILLQYLVAVGNVIGRTAHFEVEADRHFAKNFVILVGPSSVGRKGTSLGYLKRIVGSVDPAWLTDHVVSGLSSGEGLIEQVRDPRTEVRRARGKDAPELTIVDEGVADKRLLVVENEFSKVLKVARREGSILSATLRDAWDDVPLRTMVRNNPLKATGSHVSLIGHITARELKKEVTDLEIGNGFLNRFMLVAVRRSKVLPFGGRISSDVFGGLSAEVRSAIDFAQNLAETPTGVTPAAAELWTEVYPSLSDLGDDIVGSLLARGPSHVRRLAMTYAVLDQNLNVDVRHLQAALSIWKYIENTVRALFGTVTGDGLADRILLYLRFVISDTPWKSKTEIIHYLGRNFDKPAVDRSLALLRESRHIEIQKQHIHGAKKPTTLFASTRRLYELERRPYQVTANPN
jgi:hypothetical protein